MTKEQKKLEKLRNKYFKEGYSSCLKSPTVNKALQLLRLLQEATEILEVKE